MPDDAANLDALPPEELLARAKALAEELDQAKAAQLYGAAAIGGGDPAGRGRARQAQGDEGFLRDFESRFNSKTGRHTAMQPVSKSEVEQYVRILTGANVVQAMAETSQHFARAGLSPEVVRKSRERR